MIEKIASPIAKNRCQFLAFIRIDYLTITLAFFVLQSTSMIFAFSGNVDNHSNTTVKIMETLLAENDAYPLSIVPAEDDPDFSEEKQIDPPLPHPKWFKDSLLDLPQDLAEAAAANKGLILYFGQRVCTYCDVLLKDTLGQPDIIRYTQKHFDVIAFDVEGKLVVTTLSGVRETESAFTQIEKTYFTPSLIFYDKTGKEALRLRGYQSPYEFRAALDYVVSGAFSRWSFKEYLAQTEILKKK
jgi:thioredoxin-related protein